MNNVVINNIYNCNSIKNSWNCLKRFLGAQSDRTFRALPKVRYHIYNSRIFYVHVTAHRNEFLYNKTN
jgi:hypothetical protein